METESGITIRIKGDFILVTQIESLSFTHTMIAIPISEFTTIKNYIDANI